MPKILSKSLELDINCQICSTYPLGCVTN